MKKTYKNNILLGLVFISIVLATLVNGAPLSNDMIPTIQITSDVQQADTVAVLTADATDTGDNAGLDWVEIYEDGSLLDSRDCNSMKSCILVKPKTETRAITHEYYAKTKDLGGHEKTSDIIKVSFRGLNHAPQIDFFVPTDTTPTVYDSDALNFEVHAIDIDGDPLSYIWKLDGIQVSTTSFWNYYPSIADLGTHTVYVIVSDGRSGTAVQTWSVTVQHLKQPSTCSLAFTPASPITYDRQPFKAFCTCTNPEAQARLWRDNTDVSTENGVLVKLAAKPQGYQYVCNVSETQNYLAASTSALYIINQAASQINLTLNGIDGNVIVAPNEGLVINGTLIVPSKQTEGDHYIELWLDGQRINSGESNLVNATSFSKGTHNVTVIYPGSGKGNYSGSSESHLIIVNESIDVEAPVVRLLSPPNGFANGANITIKYSVIDNMDAILDCNVWSNTSGAWDIDSIQKVANRGTGMFNYTNLPNGVYIWNVKCVDDSSNSAFAPQNWSFSVGADIESPVITLIAPTPANNSVLDTNNVTINTTVTDNVAVRSVLLEWNGVNETMPNSGTNYHVSKINLNDGVYSFRVYASDTSGNLAVSEKRVFTINVSNPRPILSIGYTFAENISAKQETAATLTLKNIGTRTAYNITSLTNLDGNGLVDTLTLAQLIPNSLEIRNFSIKPVKCGNVTLNSTVGYQDINGKEYQSFASAQLNVMGSDLDIASFDVSKSSVERGKTVKFTVKVKNNAQSYATDAENVIVRIYHGSDLLKEIDLDSIAPGDSKTGSVEWKTSGNTGTATITAVADSDNECSNLDNNDAILKLTIKKAGETGTSSQIVYPTEGAATQQQSGQEQPQTTKAGINEEEPGLWMILLVLLLELIALLFLVIIASKRKRRRRYPSLPPISRNF